MSQIQDGITPSHLVKGTTTNDSASAGFVGEYKETTRPVATAVPTSGQYGTLVSISLEAGDWDVSAIASFESNGATGGAVSIMGLGTADGNSGTGMIEGVNTTGFTCPTGTNVWNGCTLPPTRVSLSATTTYYLKVFMNYTVATPNFRCRLSARRVR